MIYKSAFIGDSTDLSIPLTWLGSAFSPGEDWALIFTAKISPADADADAIFQKASGAGITVAASTATVAMVPADTVDLDQCRLAFDIQAQNITTAAVRTVATGWLALTRDVTRETTTSVPVNTAEEPLPFASTAVETHAATAKTTPVDADEFPFANSAASWLLGKVSWSNIKATLKTYFDGFYSTSNADIQSVLDSVNSQPWTAARIAGWTTGGGGTAAPLRMVFFTDSLGAVGGGLQPGPQMGNAGRIGLLVRNTTGTVTSHSPPNNGRQDYWINGCATTFAIGSTGEFTNGGSATGDIRGDKCCIAPIKQSGGGKFNLEYQAGATGAWTPVGVGTGKTFTADSSTDVFTSTAHGFANLQGVRLTVSGGTLPTATGGNLAIDTDYHVIVLTANTYKLARTSALAVAGTAIDLTSNGTGTMTAIPYSGISIDTANATQIGAFLEYSLPTSNSPFYRLRVSNVTDGPVVITPVIGIYNSNGGGVITMPVAQVSGLDITQSITTPLAVFTPIWTGLQPDMAIVLFADAGGEWDAGGAWRTFYTNAKAAFNATDYIIVSKNISYEDNAAAWANSTNYTSGTLVYAVISGIVYLYRCSSNHTSGASTQPGVGASWSTVWTLEAPQSSVETASAELAVTQATKQRAWAVYAGETFINGAAIFGSSWAIANSKGLMGDVVHPSTAGASLRNMMMWHRLFIGSQFLGGGWKIGMNEPDLNGSATSGAVSTQRVEFSRAFGVRSPSGSISLADNSALFDNSRTVVITNNNRVVTFGNALSLSFAIDGTAGLYPGYNNFTLGSASLRMKPFFTDVNISGIRILLPDTLSGAGAISLTTSVTNYTSTGASQALTLANGTAGQVKTIVHDVDGGSGILTPATKTGFSTITFTNAGDTVTLQYFTTRGWMIISSYGVTIA